MYTQGSLIYTLLCQVRMMLKWSTILKSKLFDYRGFINIVTRPYLMFEGMSMYLSQRNDVFSLSCLLARFLFPSIFKRNRKRKRRRHSNVWLLISLERSKRRQRERGRERKKTSDDVGRRIFYFLFPFSQCVGAFLRVSEKNFSYPSFSLLCKYVPIISEKEKLYHFNHTHSR